MTPAMESGVLTLTAPTAMPSDDIADPSDEPAFRVTEAIAGIFRVELGTTTIGYVQHTGERFVGLLGAVYNTSVEVAQTLTLDSAVRRLILS